MTDDRWAVTSASQIGSVHLRDHRPLQDSSLTWADGDAAVIAVADGHGHHLHFRSDVGADLAAALRVDALQGGPAAVGPRRTADDHRWSRSLPRCWRPGRPPSTST